MLTTEQRVRAIAGNYVAMFRDTSKDNHDAKNWTATTATVASGDVAAVTQVERRMTYIDAATGRLYTPGTK